MKMRIEDTLVLELCKKTKNAHAIDEIIRKRNFKLKYLFHIVDKHFIKPFVLNELLKHSLPEPVKDIVVAEAKSAVLETTLRNQMIKREFFRIKSVFEEHGIDFMLMKGLSLDFTGIRTIGDLDILIREKDLIIADKLLKDTGYDYVGDVLNSLIKNNEKKDLVKQLDWNNQFQYHNTRNRLLIELHTNLFERSRAYDFDLEILLSGIDMFWNGRQWDEDLQSFVFCNEDRLILMCLHTALKRSPYTNQFALRNLLDISALIERKIDWNRFITTSQQLRISSFIIFSLSLAIKLLSEEIPDSTLNELQQHCTKGQKFLNVIHLKSFNNLESNGLFFSNVFKMFSPFIYQKKMLPRIKRILLIPVIFPPRRLMAKRYHIDKNNPLIFAMYLLNPFWWIFLLVKRVLYFFR
jgi:hypothetical protein